MGGRTRPAFTAETASTVRGLKPAEPDEVEELDGCELAGLDELAERRPSRK